MIDRNELWAQAEDLADLIIQCPEITAYQQAEQRMAGNPAVMNMMQRLRDLEEQIGEHQARKVPESYYVHLRSEAESLLSTLETIPEVQVFMDAQRAVNDLLQSVSSKLQQSVQARVTDARIG